MRSFLTILGIVIGVAAVITMVSIGRGASVAGQEQIGTMGVMTVSAVSADAIPEAHQQIQMLLHQRHRSQRGHDDDFTIRNLADVAATAHSTSAAM